MNTLPLISIDTIEFEAEGENILLPDTHFSRVINSDGEIIAMSQNRRETKSEFGIHSLRARTKHDGRTLCVEGSPYGHKYGQNVFTSPLLLPACIVALKAVCTDCNITPSPEQKKKWMAGDINMRRVDLAVNFKIDSDSDANDVLHQIALQFLEWEIPMRRVGNSVYWAPRNGKEWTIAFYAKGPEMRRKKGLKSHPQRDALLEECENMIRVEVRLRASELRKLELAKASSWTEKTAYEVFSKYMKKLTFLSITTGLLDDDELQQLPSRLRAPFALHKAGVKLAKVFDARTLQRHNKAFKDMGIDVRTPNQLRDNVLPLKKILGPSKAYAAAPKWMIDAGMVPQPKKPLPKRAIDSSGLTGEPEKVTPSTRRKRR